MAVAENRTRAAANDACRTRRWAGFGLLASLVLGSGCGQSTPVPAAPDDTTAQAPGEIQAPAAAPHPDDGQSELDALWHDLRVQKERVDRELARKEQLAVARAEEAERDAPAAEAAPPPAPKTRAPAQPSKKKAASGAGAPSEPAAAAPRDADRETSSDWVGSPCDTACRALASMERSAERICALAGETNARCESARTLVKESRERVQASGCWCRSFDPR